MVEKFYKLVLKRAIEDKRFLNFLEEIVDNRYYLSSRILSPDCEKCIFHDECTDSQVYAVQKKGYCYSYMKRM